MKPSLWALPLTAMAVAACVPQAVSAADAPVRVESCSVYAPATTKWPMKRVHVTFRDLSDTTADAVTVKIATVGEFVDRGSFSHGALIEYDAPADKRLTALPARQLPCSVTSVHFVDGQHWQADR
jgi:hypothetical protein